MQALNYPPLLSENDAIDLNRSPQGTVIFITTKNAGEIGQIVGNSCHVICHPFCEGVNEIVRFKKVDAICLDLDEQEEEAINFLHYRAKHPLLQDLPLLVIANNQDHLENYIRAGANDYYVGNIKSSLFTVRLRNFLSHISSLSLSQNKNSPIELAYMAFYDPLTSLPNRQLFEERLKDQLKLARQTDKSFAVLFLDLDGFKTINDTYGHEAGDWFLGQVAHRLRNSIRNSDTLARIGGDEFGAILNDIENQEAVVKAAQRILYRASTPYTFRSQSLRISVSIGISFFPQQGHTYESLIHQADRAMYFAKKKGKAQFCFAS